MKTIVIFKSKSGYTKTYAQWIAQELNCDLKSAEEISSDELQKYDVIIYGGGLYVVGINGISIIKKNYEILHNKKIIVWATGSNPGRKEELHQVWKHNFTNEQLNTIKTFYLRGGFEYKKLNMGDKVLMSMLKIRLKMKNQRTEDEQGLLDAYEIPEYHCKKENIKNLVEYVRGF
jgi:menaquinone-dependent protoporphyrinogen IX oxidase